MSLAKYVPDPLKQNLVFAMSALQLYFKSKSPPTTKKNKLLSNGNRLCFQQPLNLAFSGKGFLWTHVWGISGNMEPTWLVIPNISPNVYSAVGLCAC